MSPELINFLQDRAHSLSAARAFFASRHILEVDPPSLLQKPQNDAHIELMQTTDGTFLHSSPEYAMKKLLASGFGDCYFLGHVYRRNETGSRHSPEFTMAEWYRIGFSLHQMIEESREFLSLFLPRLPLRHLSYRDAFAKYAKINYSRISLADLQKKTNSTWDRSTCLHYILTHEVEPHLGNHELTAIIDFPPYEAALANTTQKNGETVAQRFELYYNGIELANGYEECADAEELRRRFTHLNEERLKEGLEAYAIDGEFLASMKTLPPCCGVALGFDRALMLKHKLSSIAPIIHH